MLQLEYSYSFIFLCAAIAGALTWLLYYFGKSTLSKPLKLLLLTFRFTTIFVIAFLLLRPLLNYSKQFIEKPLLIVGIDNSASVIQNKDSSFYKTEFAHQLRETLNSEQLNEKFDIKFLQFGEKVRDASDSNSFEDKLSDFASFFNNINDYYAYNNVGAVVLASDGLYNRGSNPEYIQMEFNAPLYTIALGDSTTQKDQWISQVRKNKIAFLGNDFPVEINVRSSLLQGKESSVSLFGFGHLIEKKKISYAEELPSDFVTLKFMVNAEKVGNQAFRVLLENIEGESSIKNNSQLFFVEVIDSRQKILILSSLTHPDVGTIRNSLSNNENFDVEYLPHRKINELKLTELENKYSLIVLNQIPYLGQSQNSLYSMVLQSKVPKLFVLGINSDINTLNRLNTGIQLKGHNGKLNTVQASLNTSFSPFLVKADAWNYLQEAPPLKAPFAQYAVANMEILFKQRIGTIATEYPLWAMGSSNGNKAGVIAGEGLWRWKLYESSGFDSKNGLDEILDKTVNFLATRENKSRFRLEANKKLNENQDLVFDAELYNESFELNNNPEVRLKMINEEGEVYELVFSRRGDSYTINAGTWEPGSYQYEATAVLASSKFSKKGQVTVSPLSLEYIGRKADYALMNRLAVQNNGKLFRAKELANLENELMGLKAPPVSHDESRFEDLISIKWIFSLLLVLLSLEWFLRKREGVV